MKIFSLYLWTVEKEILRCEKSMNESAFVSGKGLGFWAKITSTTLKT
jgi:hypothetical protein